MKFPRQFIASIILSSLAAFAMPVTAVAEPMHDGGMEMGHHGGPEGEHTPPFLHGIRLSDAQHDKIFDLEYAQMPTLRAKFKEAHQAHKELHKLILSGQYDDAKAKALIDQSTRAMGEIEAIKASTENRIYQLLTAEQRKQVSDHMAHMENGDWHHHGPDEHMDHGQ